VRFEVDLAPRVRVNRCNCSICHLTGFIHLIVEPGQFRLLQGEDKLVEYRFHTRTARHLFCETCGIKSFYVPRSHPEGISVNLNCVDLDSAVEVEIAEFDGRNWTRSRAELQTDADIGSND
jgi:hypothetical protein